MLFWCLYCQLQGCRYWGPSQTCTLELFFRIQGTKAKFSINFQMGSKDTSETLNSITLINWLWFDWVTWRFSSSSMSTFIQIFQKLILKKKKNRTIWLLRVSRIWKILTSLFKSLLNYKLRQNIWNKIEKSSKTGQYKKRLISTFQCFLTVITKILCLEEILDTISSVF